MTERLVRQVLIEGARLRTDLDVSAIARAAELLRDAILAGKKVLLCGNGGSAADAQHIAAELVGRFVVERRPLAAISLTTDTSALTAIANDYGYEQVFARQVDALGSDGDVLIAITTSGTSKNVVAAVAAARARGMKIIGLTGQKGAAFVASCDAGVAVPSTVTARVQECHIVIGHLLCEVVDEAFLTPRPVHGNGHGPAKQMSLEHLVAWREAQRARGKTVVWTNGVFDVLHVGHLHSLKGAKAHGDLLIVGVNGDASVRLNKGPERPIFPCTERVELLAALELVDAILVFDDPTPEQVLAQVKPDVHVKGADYTDKPIPERAIVEAYGGRVELVDLVAESLVDGHAGAPAQVMRPALFLDRDGTLIVDTGYPRDPALVEVVPGAIEALRELQQRYPLVIISSQSGVARGLITEAEARAVHERVIEVFAAGGVTFAGAYYCKHLPTDGCPCRKPAPGLFHDAARELGIDLSASIMIGDKASDVEAGDAAGCETVLQIGALTWPEILAHLR